MIAVLGFELKTLKNIFPISLELFLRTLNKILSKKSLNILCRAAAMRYFLTRLYDYTNTPKTALIKIKDPREYYQKLIIHNNLKNYRDYLV